MKSSSIKVGHTYIAKLPLGEFTVRITGELIGEGKWRRWPCVGVDSMPGSAIANRTGSVFSREVLRPVEVS